MKAKGLPVPKHDFFSFGLKKGLHGMRSALYGPKLNQQLESRMEQWYEAGRVNIWVLGRVRARPGP
jgi:hypothetical protein